MGITMFISLWTTRLILNSLGASDFGIFNIVGGAISMLGFLNAAMASATQRFMSYNEGGGNREKLKTIFNVSLVMHIVLAIIVGIVLMGAGFVFFNGVLNIPEGRTAAAIVVYASLILSTMVTVAMVPYDAVINAHENMKYYAIVGILESFLKLAVAFACVYTLSDKLIVYGVLMACIPFVTFGIMCVYCHKNYSECIISPRRYYSKADLKEMTSFAGWNMLGSFVSMSVHYGQNIIINVFFGVLVNAAYGIVAQLQGQLMVFTNNMIKALMPVIVKNAGAQQIRQMLKWSFTGCRFSYILFVWIAVPFFVEAEYILALWLKEVPEWTVVFLRLVLIKTLFELSTNSLSISLSSVGQVKQMNMLFSIIEVFAVAIECCLFYAGCEPYWMFIVLITSVSMENAVRISLSHRYCGLSYKQFIMEVHLPLIVFTAMLLVSAAVPRMIMPEGFARLAFCCTATGMMFLMGAYYIFLNKEELEAVRGFWTKVTGRGC